MFFFHEMAQLIEFKRFFIRAYGSVFLMLSKHEIMQIGNINQDCLYRRMYLVQYRLQLDSNVSQCRSKGVSQFVIIDVYNVMPFTKKQVSCFFKSLIWSVISQSYDNSHLFIVHTKSNNFNIFGSHLITSLQCYLYVQLILTKQI